MFLESVRKHENIFLIIFLVIFFLIAGIFVVTAIIYNGQLVPSWFGDVMNVLIWLLFISIGLLFVTSYVKKIGSFAKSINSSRKSYGNSNMAATYEYNRQTVKQQSKVMESYGYEQYIPSTPNKSHCADDDPNIVQIELVSKTYEICEFTVDRTINGHVTSIMTKRNVPKGDHSVFITDSKGNILFDDIVSFNDDVTFTIEGSDRGLVVRTKKK